MLFCESSVGLDDIFHSLLRVYKHLHFNSWHHYRPLGDRANPVFDGLTNPQQPGTCFQLRVHSDAPVYNSVAIMRHRSLQRRCGCERRIRTAQVILVASLISTTPSHGFCSSGMPWQHRVSA